MGEWGYGKQQCDTVSNQCFYYVCLFSLNLLTHTQIHVHIRTYMYTQHGSILMQNIKTKYIRTLIHVHVCALHSFIYILYMYIIIVRIYTTYTHTHTHTHTYSHTHTHTPNLWYLACNSWKNWEAFLRTQTRCLKQNRTKNDDKMTTASICIYVCVQVILTSSLQY